MGEQMVNGCPVSVINGKMCVEERGCAILDGHSKYSLHIFWFNLIRSRKKKEVFLMQDPIPDLITFESLFCGGGIFKLFVTVQLNTHALACALNIVRYRL